MNDIQLPKSYVLTKGPDGVTWLSLEPCVADLRSMLADSQLDGAHKNIEVVLVFLDSMIQEARIQQWERAKVEREGSDEASYIESLH